MDDYRIGLREKLGFGLSSISNNIIIQFVNTFILFFYTDVFGLSPALAGGIISFGLIWDGINDPLIASFADNHLFKNGERVRPYQLYICVPLALATVLLFWAVPLSHNLKVVYAVAVYVIFYSLTTFLRLPSYALPALATRNVKERLSINTFVSAGATLGGVLASLMCWPLVRAFAGLDEAGNMINPQRGFLFGAAVIGAIIIFGSLFCYFNSAERIRPTVAKGEKISIIKSFGLLVKNANWCWNALYSTLYFVSNVLLTTTLVYYCQYVIMAPGKTTLIMAMFALGSLAALPFVKRVEIKLGRRRAMMLAACICFVAKLPFIIAPYSLAAIMVYAFIMGISVTMSIVLFSITRNEIGDIIGYKLGRRIDSMVVNLNGFMNKCGTSLTTLLIGFALEFAGYEAALSVQPQAVESAIISIMGYVAAVIALIMLFSASRITIEDELAEVKAAQSGEAANV